MLISKDVPKLIRDVKRVAIGSVLGLLLNKSKTKRVRIDAPKEKGIVVHRFVVTGVLYNSKKRFKMIYEGSPAGYSTAMSINLWKGSVYGIRTGSGKRVLLKRV